MSGVWLTAGALAWSGAVLVIWGLLAAAAGHQPPAQGSVDIALCDSWRGT